MKKSNISVEEYLKLGGKIENLDLSKTKTTYFDSYRDRLIESISWCQYNDKLLSVSFKDGRRKECSPFWIETEVTFKLEEKYTK